MKTENTKVEIVGNVSVSTEPLRTIGDYQQEQKEARERHEMFQEQHRLLMRSFRMNIVAVVAAVVSALAAIWSAYSVSMKPTPPQILNSQQEQHKVQPPKQVPNSK